MGNNMQRVELQDLREFIRSQRWLPAEQRKVVKGTQVEFARHIGAAEMTVSKWVKAGVKIDPKTGILYGAKKQRVEVYE